MNSTRFLQSAIFTLFVSMALSYPAFAKSGDVPLVARVKELTRAARWTPVAAIAIRFETFHPQGMVKIGGYFYVSSVEIRRLPKKLAVPVDGHAYDEGVGVGHLFKISRDGALITDLVLGEGSIYHPGGIDYDGTSIWIPVSEYRPDSRAIIYKVAPATMTATKVVGVADHIGGVVHDTASGRIEATSWGSRRFYSWPITSAGTMRAASTANPSRNAENYIDYQDCHYVGRRMMLCAGLAEYQASPRGPAFQLGGIDLVDLSTHRSLWQVPVPLWAPSGRVMTQNPFWIEASACGLRAYFMPDDDHSTLFVFDTVVP